MKLKLAENQSLTFYDEDQPVIITIIQSGWPGRYIVVVEDPFAGAEIQGTLQTKEDIKNALNLDLNDYWEYAQ